jgi:hypothetical protein
VTIFAAFPNRTDIHDDVDWHTGPHVSVSDNVMARVCQKLSLIFEEWHGHDTTSQFVAQGDVITPVDVLIDEEENHRLLVVSSDYFNAKSFWKFVVVVPLQSAVTNGFALTPIVEVVENRDSRALIFLAECLEVNVLDCGERRFRKIGRVSDLNETLYAIREYLGISVSTEDKPKKRPLLSEEDLARSAEARREPTNRFGMLFREMQLDTFRAMLAREGSDEGLFVPIAHRLPLERIRSRVLSLLDFPALLLEPAAALGKPEQESDVRDVSLADAFGATAEQLERELPWCGPSVEIARTFPEADGQPVYSAYASETTRELGGHSAPGNSLVITLKGPNEQRCTARLNAEQKAAIFEGDQLPGKLEVISVELMILRE